MVPEVLQYAKMSADQKKVLEVFKTYLQLYVREMARASRSASRRRNPSRSVSSGSGAIISPSRRRTRATLCLRVPSSARRSRPNINGRFEDLLLAAGAPSGDAGLYLDNAQSLGPDSMAGLITGKGLNENLGRELMELHTLGVGGGYTQADVIALAKLLTGWSLDPGGSGTGLPKYYPARPRAGLGPWLRGKTIPAARKCAHRRDQKISRMICATARHIARKFAVHFISDDPPSASVERTAEEFSPDGRRSACVGGNRRSTIPRGVETGLWARCGSPVEYVTASMRLVGWPKATVADEQDKRRSRESWRPRA